MELLSVNTTHFFVHVGFMVDRVALGQAVSSCLCSVSMHSKLALQGCLGTQGCRM